MTGPAWIFAGTTLAALAALAVVMYALWLAELRVRLYRRAWRRALLRCDDAFRLLSRLAVASEASSCGATYSLRVTKLDPAVADELLRRRLRPIDGGAA